MQLHLYPQGAQLAEQNKYEDIFDVFINFILRRSPTIFVLINMTLMIWMVQTIYSSNMEQIPKSVYFFGPFFKQTPLVNLAVTKNPVCSSGLQPLVLKTFPSIKQSSIKGGNLTKWDIDGVIFCADFSQKMANFAQQCSESEIQCSGLCVNEQRQCPITSIKKTSTLNQISESQQIIYTTKDGRFNYVIGRQNKNNFIVGLTAQFQNKCNNDFPYLDKYDTFGEYWNKSKNCGEEGSLPSDVYEPFTEMSTEQFLFTNGVWSSEIEQRTRNTYISLGAIWHIKFMNRTTQCSQIQKLSDQLQSNLTQAQMKPTFTKSMLIIAFIFFTLSWCWLIGFYCFRGSSSSKNKLMVLMLMIELIVVGFLYSQNKQIFQLQDVMTTLAQCMETQIPATDVWQAGTSNISPFKSVMFFCTVFLMLQLVAQIIDKFCYEPYYGDISQGTEEEPPGCFWRG